MQDIIKEWGPAIITVIAIFLVIGILNSEAVKSTVTTQFTNLVTNSLKAPDTTTTTP